VDILVCIKLYPDNRSWGRGINTNIVRSNQRLRLDWRTGFTRRDLYRNVIDIYLFNEANEPDEIV